MAALLLRLDGARFVHRLADDIDDAAEAFLADRHGDRRAGVMHFLAAHETFGNVHGDAADGALTQMLRDFQHQTVAAIGRLERVQNLRQMAFEFHVDHRTDDLRDMSNLIGLVRHVRLLQNES